MKLKADIIKCGFDELKKIAEIESKCIPDGWSLKAFEDWYDDKKTVVFAAVCNGEMIGFANGSWVLDEGELLNIAVLESYRNNGIAGELFEKMERFFSEKGIKIILKSGKKISLHCLFMKNMVLSKTDLEKTTTEILMTTEF